MSRTSERSTTVIDLLKFAETITLDTYVDIGCGDGSITNEISTDLKIAESYCVDILPNSEKYPKLSFQQISENDLKLDIIDHSIDLITAFVSLHHIKNIDKLMDEILRISHHNTILIIREHDVKPEDQPYIDFVHLIEIIKRYDQDSENFIKTFHSGYFSRLGLKDSLEAIGYKYVASYDYPRSVPNPQKLYTSIFQFSGPQKSWLTPLVQSTEYKITNGRLLEVLRKVDLTNYYKVLKKNSIFGKKAHLLLQQSKISEFIKLYQLK